LLIVKEADANSTGADVHEHTANGGGGGGVVYSYSLTAKDGSAVTFALTSGPVGDAFERYDYVDANGNWAIVSSGGKIRHGEDFGEPTVFDGGEYICFHNYCRDGCRSGYGK
jgi:hypothetical protein